MEVKDGEKHKALVCAYEAFGSGLLIMAANLGA